jgi:hypothetical protein
MKKRTIAAGVIVVRPGPPAAAAVSRSDVFVDAVQRNRVRLPKGDVQSAPGYNNPKMQANAGIRARISQAEAGS